MIPLDAVLARGVRTPVLGPGETVDVDPRWRPAWDAAVARWCSMETCGNRAEAGRHYARSRLAG